MQVPKELNFNALQTKAFFSVYKQWPIQPISNGGQYWPGQVVRIFLNALTDGVMDPYRSHIQITVSCSQATLPVGLLQIDSSAQSFIQQIVISSKNRQIERIVQYGVLAAYLTDIGYSELYTQGKQVQGLGYTNLDTYSNMYNATFSSSNSVSFENQSTGMFVIAGGNGTCFPTIPTRYNNLTQWGSQASSLNLLKSGVRGHMSVFNQCWFGSDIDVWYWYQFSSGGVNSATCNDPIRTTGQAFYGYNQNIRGEYIHSIMERKYIDTASTLSNYEIRLNSSVYNGTFPAKFSNATVYQPYIPLAVPFGISSKGGVTKYQTVANSTSLLGYTNFTSPLFSKGVGEPFISPTVPQAQMINGSMAQSKVPINRRTFKIPLLSSTLGLLIPQAQFVLIPIRALNDTLIEMTLDPFAMFTSGYNDIAEFDNVGMGLMQARAYTVERVVYNLHTYQFWNPQMDEYLKVSLSTGIAINTKFWQLGNQYQIQNSQSITNSWPVACNQEALAEIVILFVPLDYQSLTFCRKHYRISNNVTKLQLRINMEYFPSQPLSGNAGNPIQIDATGNNSIFLEQIYMAKGFTFEKTIPIPRINAFNFAINDRPYDVYNTHTFYDPAMIDDPSYTWTTMSVNSDTAMGMSFLHQNRYVGRAAYLFSFEPYSHSKNFLTGIDTRAAKSFDVIFTCSPDNPFLRAQTMYIYTCSSVIIQYTGNGIVNINR